jgi:hypothetical protein
MTIPVTPVTPGHAFLSRPQAVTACHAIGHGEAAEFRDVGGRRCNAGHALSRFLSRPSRAPAPARAEGLYTYLSVGGAKAPPYRGTSEGDSRRYRYRGFVSERAHRPRRCS